eukprot:SAG11_NODE_2976_length_2796_cov_5.021505_2_plen_192_part_00
MRVCVCMRFCVSAFLGAVVFVLCEFLCVSLFYVVSLFLCLCVYLQCVRAALFSVHRYASCCAFLRISTCFSVLCVCVCVCLCFAVLCAWPCLCLCLSPVAACFSSLCVCLSILVFLCGWPVPRTVVLCTYFVKRGLDCPKVLRFHVSMLHRAKTPTVCDSSVLRTLWSAVVYTAHSRCTALCDSSVFHDAL